MSLKKIRNGLFSLIGLVALLIAASGVVSTAAHACEVPIIIDVSPNILNIQSKSTVLTVHTDIAFSLVNGSTVCLIIDDLPPVLISWSKADDCGNFVAKFSMDDIKPLLEETGLVGDCKFTVNGTTTSTPAESFCGDQVIRVANNVPNGK
ncbi:MAG: hypothetical protein WBC77_09365 [Candidatus Zixiibacteriota bacterium]